MSTDEASDAAKTKSQYPDSRQSEGQILTGPGTDTLLQTDGLVKTFDGFRAVDGVDFAVESGELHCLIGPNGAGKSTLMKLITGRHAATEGQIFFDGREITHLEPNERIDRGLSIKFQVPSVYEELTVRENVRLPVQRVADSRADRRRRIADTLETVGLDDRPDDLVGDLSHGQQQQLEIGMAAALEPELLLLDEPVAGLSVDERREIAERIEALNDEGIAFVVIEHDTDFVARIADEVTVLHQGQIFREGSIDEIRADPEVRRIYLGGDSDGDA